MKDLEEWQRSYVQEKKRTDVKFDMTQDRIKQEIAAIVSTITDLLDPERYKDLTRLLQNRLEAALTALEVMAYSPELPEYQEQVMMAKILTLAGEAVVTCARSVVAMVLIIHKIRCIQDKVILEARTNRTREHPLRNLDARGKIHVPLERIIIRKLATTLWIYHGLELADCQVAREYEKVTTLVMSKNLEITLAGKIIESTLA
jgi:hypothetical protein